MEDTHSRHGGKRHQEVCCPEETVWNTLGRQLPRFWKQSTLGQSNHLWNMSPVPGRQQPRHTPINWTKSKYWLEDNPWCHENHSYSWKGENCWSWTNGAQKTSQTSHPCKKDEREARPLWTKSSKLPQKRLKRRSLNNLIKEQQKEHTDI